jgi:hypothetical protein
VAEVLLQQLPLRRLLVKLHHTLEVILQLSVEIHQYLPSLDALIKMVLAEGGLLVCEVEFLDDHHVHLGLLEGEALEVGEEQHAEESPVDLQTVHVLASLGAQRKHLEDLVPAVGELEGTQQQLPYLQKVTGCSLALEDLRVFVLLLQLLETGHAERDRVAEF